ncbi:hypothetical protein H072_4348 [Dactylellina haptotyla CBS 200.50]|uniref:Yeast cell wall synthesis Kre9/Knh1-like N-terminal domain-containing protein n=1 Tax=Dactylellina haptotyla (strain CBS 200.50) TaxID=1284197 RepID=S8AKY1_DACHA|nr:hypothetical protein H072_4348 [Dactylellina haptotyla CBS 200.50]
MQLWALLECNSRTVVPILIAFAAFLLATEAAIGDIFTAPTPGERINVGSPYKLVWDASIMLSGIGLNTVTVVLGQPNGKEFQAIMTIGESIPNSGSYVWSVPSDLASGVYQLKIWNDDVPNNLVSISQRFYLNGVSNTVATTLATQPTADQTSTHPSETPLRTSQTRTTRADSDSNLSSGSEESSSRPTSIGSRTSTSITETLSPSVTTTPNNTQTRSLTDSPTSSSTPSPPASSNPPIGAIVGGVIGGLVVIVTGALIGIWILAKERRKRAFYMGEKEMPPLPPAPPDPQNQSIWEGGAVQSINPRQDLSGIYPGRDTLVEGVARS